MMRCDSHNLCIDLDRSGAGASSRRMFAITRCCAPRRGVASPHCHSYTQRTHTHTHCHYILYILYISLLGRMISPPSPFAWRSEKRRTTRCLAVAARSMPQRTHRTCMRLPHMSRNALQCPTTSHTAPQCPTMSCNADPVHLVHIRHVAHVALTTYRICTSHNLFLNVNLALRCQVSDTRLHDGLNAALDACARRELTAVAAEATARGLASPVYRHKDSAIKSHDHKSINLADLKVISIVADLIDDAGLMA